MRFAHRIAALIVLQAVVTVLAPGAARAQFGTSFSYQGSLEDLGLPADSTYDMHFGLWDAPNAGTQLGATIEYDVSGAGTVTVIDGLFNVALDFGAGVFDGSPRWLEISVRDEDPADLAPYTLLAPRVELAPVPYAILAGTFGGDGGPLEDTTVTESDLNLMHSGVVSDDVGGELVFARYLDPIQTGGVTRGRVVIVVGGDLGRGEHSFTGGSGNIDILGCSPQTISLPGGGIRPWTLISSIIDWSSGCDLDVVITATTAANPVIVRWIGLVPVENDAVDDADADPLNEIQDLAGVLAEGNNAGGVGAVNLGATGIGVPVPATPLHVAAVSGPVSAVKADGMFAPTNGYLGVQGTDDFDGVASLDIFGEEIGMLGLSTGASVADNYGVLGHSNGWGGRFEHSSGGNRVLLGGAAQAAAITGNVGVTGTVTATSYLGNGTGLANVHNTNVALAGSTLQVTDAGGTLGADLSALIDDGDWAYFSGIGLTGDLYRGGNVALGAFTDPDGHGLNVQNYTNSRAAVRGVNDSGGTTYSEGMLGVLSPAALPIPVTNVGVLGLKTSNGSDGAAVYGWNSGLNTVNYAGLFVANGTGTTNYGVYGRAENGANNWGGYFIGDVHASSRIGLRNTAPAADLHIKQSASPFPHPSTGGIILEEVAGTDRWQIWNSSNFLSFAYNGARVAYIGTAGDYIITSDRSVKKDVTPMPDGTLDKVMNLRPLSYRLNHADPDSRKSIGFIAQEVGEVMPELVVSEGEGSMRALSYSDFGVVAIKAIQEQQAVIEGQQARISELEAALAGIQRRLGIADGE